MSFEVQSIISPRWTQETHSPPSTVSASLLPQLLARSSREYTSNRTPTLTHCDTVWTFFALSALDIATNAAAGPAAVATAIHMTGGVLTARALQLGALAGVTKSGVLAFIEYLAYAGVPTPAWILLILLGSSFGICVLVTAEISNLVLGESMCLDTVGWLY